jgi:hypothetical protein
MDVLSPQIAPDTIEELADVHEQPSLPTESRKTRRIRVLLIFEQLVFGGAELLHFRLAQGLPRIAMMCARNCHAPQAYGRRSGSSPPMRMGKSCVI